MSSAGFLDRFVNGKIATSESDATETGTSALAGRETGSGDGVGLGTGVGGPASGVARVDNESLVAGTSTVAPPSLDFALGRGSDELLLA